jgi:hypothetical protein
LGLEATYSELPLNFDVESPIAFVVLPVVLQTIYTEFARFNLLLQDHLLNHSFPIKLAKSLLDFPCTWDHVLVIVEAVVSRLLRRMEMLAGGITVEERINYQLFRLFDVILSFFEA